MPNPKRRRVRGKKKSGKVKVSQSVSVRKKGTKSGSTAKMDTVQGRPPADVAPTFKVKIRKK